MQVISKLEKAIACAEFLSQLDLMVNGMTQVVHCNNSARGLPRNY